MACAVAVIGCCGGAWCLQLQLGKGPLWKLPSGLCGLPDFYTGKCLALRSSGHCGCAAVFPTGAWHITVELRVGNDGMAMRNCISVLHSGIQIEKHKLQHPHGTQFEH